MEHQNPSVTTAGLPGPAQPVPGAAPSKPPKPPKRIYETDGRDRALLVLTLALGMLMADLFLMAWQGWPGLEVTLLCLLWEGVQLWYTARRGRLDRTMLLLTAAVVLLALTFTLYSDRWLYQYNLLALPALMMVQMFQGHPGAKRTWRQPLMLGERLLLLFDGLFGYLGAPLSALSREKDSQRHRRIGYVLLGLVLTLPVLFVVLLVLASADSLFNLLAGEAMDFVVSHFGSLLGRLILGLLAAPFLFSLLYSLRRPRPWTSAGGGEGKPWKVDPALPVTALVLLDGLYLCFVGVQFAALFGGPEYLARAGISYAEYARSGFFQLVGVSFLNLAVVVSAVQICRREGRLWRAVQVLSTAMVALSGVMLVSACSRMTLYVREYGLSFKRLLTYWGMAMLVVFFLGALLKVWKRDFGFFQVLFAASIAGWLLLNAANPDAIVARYNVNAYLSGSPVMDLPYLAELSYDALPALEALPGDMLVYYAPPSRDLAGCTLDQLIASRRAQAAQEAGVWQTWTLSAWRAARG